MECMFVICSVALTAHETPGIDKATSVERMKRCRVRFANTPREEIHSVVVFGEERVQHSEGIPVRAAERQVVTVNAMFVPRPDEIQRLEGIVVRALDRSG